MQSAFEAIVSGRVQGVFFRDFVRMRAEALGLFGEAENLPDGTVRVCAEGEKSALDAFIADLREGTASARVDSLVVSWNSAAGVFSGFSIK
jgi:acylphosphatase